MSKLLKAPTKNAIQKTLAAQLLNTATTGDPISFDDVDGIDNAPGTLVINRVDSNGTATASKREYIEYSGTSGNTVIIETRNVDGSNSALTHAVGSIVEFVPDVTWANRMYTALSTLVDTDDITVINPAVVTNPLSATSFINSSGATISAILDEDTMVSNRADAVPTQQSVKTYIDTPTKSIVLPAGSMSPTTTAGCADVATVEAGTNDVDYKVLDFDKDTDESAFIVFAMPDSWNGGTITFQPYWTTAGTTGTVVFSLAGRAFANDDAIDQAYGTPQTSTDTFIAAGDVHIGPVSSPITLAGTPAGGQLVQLKITRDVSEDTLDADARLIAIKLEYGLSAHSD